MKLEKLAEYCRKNNLNYRTMWFTLQELGYNATCFKKFDKAKELVLLRQKIRNGKPEWVIDGMSLFEYCKKHGLRYATIYARLRKGVPLEQALLKKIKKSEKSC